MMRRATGPVTVLALLLAACASGGEASEAPGGGPSDGTSSASSTPPASPTDTPATQAPPSAEATTEARTAEGSGDTASVTIGATGDLLPHAPVLQSAAADATGTEDYDFGPMFADVRDLISAPDLSLCHLETPLSADDTNLTVPRVLVFNSPHELADAVEGAGWDGCDFASNHTMDHGLDGLAQTESVVRDAGLGYTGPTARRKRAGIPQRYAVNGAQVAHLAYTYTLPNSGEPTTTVPGDGPWLERNLWPAIGADGILADAAAARAAGADFVVVSMHWGQEYQTEPTEQQRAIAEQVLSSDDVDLILGTHVHVIQPCERIDGKLVLYGMGNFLSNQSPDTTAGALRPETQEGMVAQVTLTRSPDGDLRTDFAMQPTRVDLDGHVVRLATPQQHPETYRRTMDTMRMLEDDGCGVQVLP